MSIRSRLQAPYQSQNSENPYLTPLPPQVDINSSRGRFQQVNLGTASAEDRTKLPSQIIEQTDIVEDTPFEKKKTFKKVVKTVIE